jgi:N-acetylglucosamine-6-phosphate deacetylase
MSGAVRGLLITHARVLTPAGVTPDQAVLCRAGRIIRVGPTAEVRGEPADEVLDAQGRYLAPGFIDLHLHGCGRWLIDNGPQDLAAIARLLPRYGVTGFLPTVCPRPKKQDADFLRTLATVESQGAAFLGFHLEGPFLTLTGALPQEALGTRDPERVTALRDAARPYQAVFSIAPDFEGIGDLLPLMTAGGVPAFITHTRATVAQTQAAIAAGARHATHFYDVFPLPAETEPGVRPCGAVEAILADPRVSVDFILDGVHVPLVAVQMALQAKGPDRVCLITDANVGAGLPGGRYQFAAGIEVEIAALNAPARLTEKSDCPGALAGSGLTLDVAVRNAVKLLGLSPTQAVRMAGANPARVLGLTGRKGEIADGCDADLVLLNDALEVQRTWVGGVCRYDGNLTPSGEE